MVCFQVFLSQTSSIVIKEDSQDHIRFIMVANNLSIRSMLEKSDVQSYTMVINGGGMVDGKTSSSALKKDSYAEVVARKPWKGFKIAGQITKPKRATVEEKRMKGKQLLLAYE